MKSKEKDVKVLHITDYEIALRLLLACVFGGIVGFQRERHDSPAGIRTYILVSLGASLIMMISMYGFSDFPNGDPARLAAQVVSGIGFLGAGTILRDGVTVKGLTTAASLWVVAAIGLAVGAGLYYSSFLVTVLVFITLERSIEIYFFSSRLILKITLMKKCAIESINCTLKSHRIMVRNISIKLLEEDQNKMTFEYTLRTPFYEIYTEKIIKEIRELDGIYSVEKVND